MSFRFFSIPVTVRGSFWLLSALFAVSRLETPVLAAEWIAVMALAIFAHELGHALAFRYYGHTPEIELHGMGGLTRSIGGTERLGPGRDAIITFAGPFAGYVLALIVWSVTRVVDVPEKSYASVLVADLLWASAGWSTLNLCPILPLDGGLLMYAALRAKLGRKAPLVAHAASLVVAVAAMLASRWAGWTWTLYMCVWFAARNGQALVGLWGADKAPAAPAPAPSSQDPLFLRAQALACETWLRKGEVERALEIARGLPPDALGPELYAKLQKLSVARQAQVVD